MVETLTIAEPEQLRDFWKDHLNSRHQDTFDLPDLYRLGRDIFRIHYPKSFSKDGNPVGILELAPAFEDLTMQLGRFGEKSLLEGEFHSYLLQTNIRNFAGLNLTSIEKVTISRSGIADSPNPADYNLLWDYKLPHHSSSAFNRILELKGSTKLELKPQDLLYFAKVIFHKNCE